MRHLATLQQYNNLGNGFFGARRCLSSDCCRDAIPRRVWKRHVSMVFPDLFLPLDKAAIYRRPRGIESLAVAMPFFAKGIAIRRPSFSIFCSGPVNLAGTAKAIIYTGTDY